MFLVDFFDKLYSLTIKQKILHKIKLNAVIHILAALLSNILVPIYFTLTKNKNGYALKTVAESKVSIIVSFTSIPTRIGRIWLVIETILRQTRKPDKIILWLSREQFPSFDLLPRKLKNQITRGLEIRLVDGDIRPHKKYYYTMKEFPNAYILTIDDDTFYRSTMVEDLFNYLILNPSCVISQYVRKMQWDQGELASYSFWPLLRESTTPNLFSFFGSGGGTLFPPSSMDSDVFNLELSMSLTPNADDVWLNAMCRLKGTPIVKTSYFTELLPVFYLRNVTLDSINNGMKQNDAQILAVREYYLIHREVDPFLMLI